MSLFFYICDVAEKKLQKTTRDRIKGQFANTAKILINEYSEDHLQLIYTASHKECLQIFYNERKDLVFFLQGCIFESVNGLDNIGPDNSGNSLKNQIVKRYIAKGIASCTGLNGMYNLIVWDKKRRCLEIAGDRLGILQLFFASLGNGALVITTDIIALKHIPGYRPKISRRGLFDLFYRGIAWGGRSILENVDRLLPNACYRVSNLTLTLIDKYRLLFSDKRWSNSLEKTLDELEHYYVQAIKRQMLPRDTVVFLQSGGKDSRIFSYFLNQAGIIPHCFSRGANHHGDVYLAKETSKALCFPWKRIQAGKDFYPDIAKRILEIDSFSLHVFDTSGEEMIGRLPLEPDYITTAYLGDVIFGSPIRLGNIKENNDALFAFTNYFNYVRSGFLSDAELKELFPQDGERWLADYHQEALKSFLDSGDTPFQMLIGNSLLTAGRFKHGSFLRNIYASFSVRAPNLDNDLMDFIFSLPIGFLDNRHLLDVFLMQRAKRLGAIHLDQNYHRYKALVFSPRQKLKFSMWHNYVRAIKLPILSIFDPLSATTQFYIQIFSLRHKGFQEIKNTTFSRVHCLEDILDVSKAKEIFQRPLPSSKDHIIPGNTLRSMITAVIAVDAFN